MPIANITVADDLVVSLSIIMKLEPDRVITRSQKQKPIIFLQGRGQIIPGVERAIYGMAIHDEQDLVVEPVDGFGEVDPTNVKRVPRSMFPTDWELQLGEEMQVRDPSGLILDAYVTNIAPDSVLLDFNHPLAGETLYVHLKVEDIRVATPEELDQGYVQN